MRWVILMVLLPLAATADESSSMPELDALFAAVREALTAPPADAPAPETVQSPTPVPGTAPAKPALDHVPVPTKTITIRAFEDIDDVDQELESARRAMEGS